MVALSFIYFFFLSANLMADQGESPPSAPSSAISEEKKMVGAALAGGVLGCSAGRAAVTGAYILATRGLRTTHQIETAEALYKGSCIPGAILGAVAGASLVPNETELEESSHKQNMDATPEMETLDSQQQQIVDEWTKR
jgi:hypothetical protein